MELGTILEPGQRVRLKVNEATAPYVVQTYLPGKLIVCKAIKQPIPITPDISRVSIIKNTERGLYIIKAQFKESSERGAIIALINLSDAQFIQRREHYRLNHDAISVPIEIELFPQNNANRYKRLKLHDISAGGIGLTIKASSAFTEGMHVKLTLNFDHRSSVNAIGEIVHISAFKSSSRDYLVGIKYVQIDKASLETLMSFIQEQVVLDRKDNPAGGEAEVAEALGDY